MLTLAYVYCVAATYAKHFVKNVLRFSSMD